MKIGTIGTGFIVEWFLTSASKLEEAQVVAVYSRKEETGRALADKFGIAKVYTDLDEMLSNPEIDCIYVASPNSLHYPQSKKALLAGKHVLCEKPFTSTVKEFDDLCAIAKEKGLLLMEAIVTMHMPNYQTLREKVKELGKIRMIQCNFSQYSSRYDQFLNGQTPNVFNPEFSGGALADLNIYNLHFVLGLFGKPQELHYYPNMQRGIDTSGVAILEYDGFKAVCVGCKDSRSQTISQIQGEKGYIVLDSVTSLCDKMTLITPGQTEVFSIAQESPALYYELKDFIAMFNTNDTQLCEKQLAHSREVMEVYETLRHDGNIQFGCEK